MPVSAARLSTLLVVVASVGCGYTLRAGVGPTIDERGRPGVMARVECGMAFGFGDTYTLNETAGLTGGAGVGYGDEDPPLAAGLTAGLDLARQPDDGYGVRFGPIFRLEGPNGGGEDQGATYGVGGRVALLKVLRSDYSSDSWSGSGHEKGGFNIKWGWDTVRHLALEASAELLWNDDRGQRLRFGLMIGYEKTGVLRN